MQLQLRFKQIDHSRDEYFERDLNTPEGRWNRTGDGQFFCCGETSKEAIYKLFRSHYTFYVLPEGQANKFRWTSSVSSKCSNAVHRKVHSGWRDALVHLVTKDSSFSKNKSLRASIVFINYLNSWMMAGVGAIWSRCSRNQKSINIKDNGVKIDIWIFGRIKGIQNWKDKYYKGEV